MREETLLREQTKVHSDMISQLDEAVAEVFQVVLGRRCLPEIGVPGDPAGVTARIRFSGALRGECAVHLDHAAAGRITAELTGGEDPDLLLDTVGELCNMIAGVWKSRLKDQQSGCGISTPEVTERRALDPMQRDSLRRYRCQDTQIFLELRID